MTSSSKKYEVTKETVSQQHLQETAEHQKQLPSVSASHEVADIAYIKAKNRGFLPGNELNDWLEAEQELRLKSENKS
ncbi:MAG: DUF2934 domain-containing protein [Methylobacter sp.]|jgi:hypothetical protein|nr:DUF2934 domain-containing protein [Methylobacter sp.]